MIPIQGNLNVRSIDGRYGPFNVGTLDTAIGIFAVKDSTIEEFEEGNYAGEFIIEKIEAGTYTSGGRVVVEVMARLGGITLFSQAPEEPAYAGLEKDPIEDELEMSSEEFSDSFDQQPDPQEDAQGVDEPDNELATLFGELWPLGDIVKLDPTHNRKVFRVQKDYLKSTGYVFDFQEQHWVKG